MKNLKYFIPFIFAFLFFNCEKNSNNDACPTTDLQITDEYSWLWQNYDTNTFVEPNQQWQWNKTNDTLALMINVPTGGESAEYNKFYFKMNSDCVSFLEYQEIFSSDQIMLDLSGNIISGMDTLRYNNGIFILQEWLPNTRIVGRYEYTFPSGMSRAINFWVDFEQDNHFDN